MTTRILMRLYSADFQDWINCCTYNEEVPGILLYNTPFQHYKVSDFYNDVAFDPSQDTMFEHSQRSAIFFGPTPYSYGKITHTACQKFRGTETYKLYDKVMDTFHFLKLNSVIINRYHGNGSFIPLHSDNENCIEQNSWILGLTIGQEREFQFEDTKTKVKFCRNFRNGDIILMSRASQNRYKHAVLRNNSQHTPGESETEVVRISFTFRKLKMLREIK